MTPQISTLFNQAKESPTLLINQKVLNLRQKGKDIYHFGFGQSPFLPPPQLQEELKNNSHHNEYLPTKGLLALREKISKFLKQHFKYNFDPDHILIGPGSKEMLFQALFALEGPLFIPAPSWVSYGPQASFCNKEVHILPTSIENGYKLKKEVLEKACKRFYKQQQKILIINSPNNPSGAVYHKEEILPLVEVCREHNILVISDEIYALVNFSSDKKQGFPTYYPEGSLLTSGLSKSHSAGGYRLGFIALPPQLSSLADALTSLMSETFSSVAAPIQYASCVAYEKSALDYTQKCTLIHKVCAQYLHQRLQKMGLLCPKPEGGFYLFPSFSSYKEKLKKRGIQSSTELSLYLLEKHSVALLPGSAFYMPEESFTCRMSTVDYDGPKVFKAAQDTKTLSEAFVEEQAPHLKKGCDAIESFLSQL
ncbi:MAG: aminotransferase class I/II-fold pyridoxal phosphate-dependent enzyme [Bdellovibrio sp.]|nr:MAG: aminotransferase class I/II-fold pyridoxal phosphate-dependent enzyme [Bdellovibrio sp.]